MSTTDRLTVYARGILWSLQKETNSSSMLRLPWFRINYVQDICIWVAYLIHLCHTHFILCPVQKTRQPWQEEVPNLQPPLLLWGHDKWIEGTVQGSVKQPVCKSVWYRIPSSLIMWHFRRFKNTTKRFDFRTKGGTEQTHLQWIRIVLIWADTAEGRFNRVVLCWCVPKKRTHIRMKSTDPAAAVMILRVRCQYGVLEQ